MPAVARIGDTFDCGDTIASGSGDVFINNLPAARISDMTTGHAPSGHTLFSPVPIVEGSGSVFVNNLPIARVGDAHTGHCDIPHPIPHCHPGIIAAGSGDVFSG